MSSHHFVRAEQATCLYVKGKAIDLDLFQQLLEWNPVVIGTNDTQEWLQSLNIKMDILVCNGAAKLDFPYELEVWNVQNDKEAIQLVFEKIKAARISIIGATNVEWIHNYMLQNVSYNCSLFESNRKHFVLKGENTFRKWVNKGFQFSISKIEEVELKGDFEKKENEYVTLSDGLIIIHSLNNLIVTEYL